MNQDDREELQSCDECASEQCAICGHEPCPECLDDCDHADCLIPGKTPNSLDKTHTCIFQRCPKHSRFATKVVDVDAKFVELVVQAPEAEEMERLKQGLIQSGMRETTCQVCGCWMLTRGTDERCPPCRKAAR